MSHEQPERRHAGSCFVIATRRRHDYLLGTVQSLVQQTVLPKELCIVDSGEEAPSRARIEQLCAEVGVELDYVHPAPRGLPVQRNLGIDRTSGDPVFLVDDDVWMAPDAHEEVLREYERWGPELGGVRGVPLRPSPPNRLAILWRKFFGISAWRSEASGRIRSGFFAEETAARSAGVRTVQFFNGLLMSYRREVFDHERFDESLSGYASKEDIDFSYRLAKRGYVLVQTPTARIHHFKSPSERLSPFEFQRMGVANQLYLHRKNMPQTLRYKAGLWWGLTGLLVLAVARTIQYRDTRYVTGLVVGVWEQVHGRGLVDPVGERERGAAEGAPEPPRLR
jgi:GT2 family glycosyltransferase